MTFSPVEWLATLFGLVNVFLVVRRSVWNFPFGVATVALQGWVYLGSRLYSDALLQLFFVVINMYGWWVWARNRTDAGEVQVRWMAWPARIGWLTGCAAAIAAWGWLMHRFTDAALPWWDASVAMMSVAAQIIMSRRFIENWIAWIAVDVVAIGVYATKDLWLFAGLYAVFLTMSVWGLIDWRRRVAA